MKAFTRLTGIAAPLLQNDVNTDQISPVAGHGVDTDYSNTLFYRQRYDSDDNEIADFVLNLPQFKAAQILITGDNFGCGSSRESAVWSLAGYGIRCVIALSFADIFRENCLRNGVLPVVLPADQHRALASKVAEIDGAEPFTADLEAQKIVAPDKLEFPFDIAAAERDALLRGLDDIGVSLEHEDEIAAWEHSMAERRPWLQTAARPR